MDKGKGIVQPFRKADGVPDLDASGVRTWFNREGN